MVLVTWNSSNNGNAGSTITVNNLSLTYEPDTLTLNENANWTSAAIAGTEWTNGNYARLAAASDLTLTVSGEDEDAVRASEVSVDSADGDAKSVTLAGNALTIAGALAVGTAVTLDIRNTVSIGGVVKGEGTVAVTGTALDLSGKTLNHVTLAVNAGSSVNLTDAVLNGCTITVADGGSVNLSGATITDCQLTNSGTVTVSGGAGGTLFQLEGRNTEAAPNTYTLIVNENDGTITGWTDLTFKNFINGSFPLSIRDGLSLGSPGAVTVTVGAALNLVWNGGETDGIWLVGDTQMNWLHGSEPTAFAVGDSAAFNTANANLSLGGDIQANAITVSESTTIDFAEHSLAADTVSVAEGKTLQVKYGNDTSRFTVTSPIQIANDATVQFNNSVPSANSKVVGPETGTGKVVLNNSGNSTELFVRDGNILSGAVSVEKIGDRKITFETAQNYTGGIVLTEGNLGFMRADSLGSGPITFNGGTLVVQGGGNLSLANMITVNANAASASTIHTQAATLTLTGTVTVPDGVSLGKNGGGTLNLNGNTTVNGTLTQNEGSITAEITSGRRFTIGENANVTMGTLMLESAGNVTQTHGRLTLTGQLKIHDTNNNQNDSYTISGGVLNVTKNGGTGTGSAVLIGHYPGAGTGQAANRDVHATLMVSDNGVVNVPNGQIQIGWDSAGKLLITENGEVNAQEVTKEERQFGSSLLEITGGRLNLGTGGLIANGTSLSVTVNGGTIGALADWSTSQAIKIGSTGVVFDTCKRAVSLNGASTPVEGEAAGAVITINSVLSDNTSSTGKLTKTGVGELKLTAANTYTGETVIEAGTLTIGHVNALTTSSSVSVAEGATLNIAIDGVSINEQGQIVFPEGSASRSLLAAGNFNPETFKGSLAINGTPLSARKYTIHPDGIHYKRPFVVVIL